MSRRLGTQFCASLRTHGAIERAEVCVVVIDASEPLTEQDLRILTSVEEAGRALVIAFNKWDLTDEERRRYLGREIERDLVHFEWAAKINISALTGRHVDLWVGDPGSTGRLGDSHPNREVERIPREDRCCTAASSAWREAAARSIRDSAHAGPPTLVLFTSGQLEPGYLRFLQRRLREEFGFRGTQMHLEVRAREKRKRK